MKGSALLCHFLSTTLSLFLFDSAFAQYATWGLEMQVILKASNVSNTGQTLARVYSLILARMKAGKNDGNVGVEANRTAFLLPQPAGEGIGKPNN